MPYVSARYGPPPEPPMNQQMIIATDDQGREWWVPPDCAVGDWLDFVAAGGVVTPYVEPQQGGT